MFGVAIVTDRSHPIRLFLLLSMPLSFHRPLLSQPNLFQCIGWTTTPIYPYAEAAEDLLKKNLIKHNWKRSPNGKSHSSSSDSSPHNLLLASVCWKVTLLLNVSFAVILICSLSSVIHFIQYLLTFSSLLLLSIMFLLAFHTTCLVIFCLNNRLLTFKLIFGT